MRRLAALLRENWLTLGIIAALLIAFVALRSSPTEIATVAAFDGDLTRGEPTVVFFYSNA
jgi:hypothetical protein